MHITDMLQVFDIEVKYPEGIVFPENIPHVPIPSSFVST